MLFGKEVDVTDEIIKRLDKPTVAIISAVEKTIPRAGNDALDPVFASRTVYLRDCHRYPALSGQGWSGSLDSGGSSHGSQIRRVS